MVEGVAGWVRWRWWPGSWCSTRLNRGQHLEGASAGQDADQLADVAGWWPGQGVPVALVEVVALYQVNGGQLANVARLGAAGALGVNPLMLHIPK